MTTSGVPVPDGPPLGLKDVLSFQRIAGNRAVATLVRRRARVQEGDVVLQRGGPEPSAPAGPVASTRHTPVIRLSVRVDREMDPREFLIEFTIQWQGNDISTPEEAEEAIHDGRVYWVVDGAPAPVDQGPRVTKDDVDKGYKLATVFAVGVPGVAEAQVDDLHRDFWKLPDPAQAEVNRQTNELFWKLTGYKVGKKLDPAKDPDDRLMAQDWLRLRAEVMHSRERYYAQPVDVRSQLYEVVPLEARPFLFRKGSKGTLAPKDFFKALQIASNIADLTPSERAEYLARVTGETNDWDAFERSIDRFIAERGWRAEVAEEREDTKTELFGTDTLYEKYREYIDARDAPRGDNSFGRDLLEAEALGALREEWLKHGFSSFAQVEAFFEPRTKAFLNVFEREALLVAREMLDRYLHVVFVEERRLRDPAQVEMFWASLTAVGDDRQMLIEDYPLLRDEDLRDELGKARNKEWARTIVGRHVAERRSDIAKTRNDLEADPELIYGFDVLREHTLIAQGVEAGSVYHRIVMTKKREIETSRLFESIAWGVLAIAAGLLTGGGGAVAVLGAATAATIGAYETLQEYRRYEMEQAAHGAGLLSDDPSFAWVVVAAVGAGVDMAAVGRAVRALRPAVETLETSGDVAVFTRKYDDIVRKTKDKDVVKALEDAHDSILKAAKMRALEQQAWRDILIPATRANDVLAATGESFARLVYAVYTTLKVHGRNLSAFLKTREARMLLGELAANPAAHKGQLAQLREGFLAALAAQERVVRHANKLRLRDFEIDHWIRTWARKPTLSADELLAQMDAYAAPLAATPGSKYRYATGLIADDDTRRLLEEFDLRIAGRGGIEKINAIKTAAGEKTVTIEGRALPSIKNRPVNAPNFNKSGNLLTAKELGLSSKDWEWAHLWGPGFGDEAAAGLMMAPREVNQVFQNRGVEGYIRDLAKRAAAGGGEVRVKAAATSWPDPTPSGFQLGGAEFLQRAEYRITLDMPGHPPRKVEVVLEAQEPPVSKLADKPDVAGAVELEEYLEALGF